MEQLRTYLERNDIRRSAFADDLGVSRGYVTELLTGKKTPGLHLAVKISDVTQGAVPPNAWVSAVGSDQ